MVRVLCYEHNDIGSSLIRVYSCFFYLLLSGIKT